MCECETVGLVKISMKTITAAFIYAEPWHRIVVPGIAVVSWYFLLTPNTALLWLRVKQSIIGFDTSTANQP